jgi:hypothetical protein
MKIIDKTGILEKPEKIRDVSIELGCGNSKRDPSSIGIDLLDSPCVDLVGDVSEVLSRLPEACAQRVYAEHFLEHVENISPLMEQIGRILTINGKLEVVVPHFSNPYFYSDPTHKTAFGLYSMNYFSNTAYFNRGVPSYANITCFEIERVHLTFKSPPPFYVRYGMKKIFERLVNVNRFTQELYEELFCYIFPCYEVTYCLKRIATN